jgi:hypothetical protein
MAKGDKESEEFLASPATGCELQSGDGSDGEKEQEHAYVDHRVTEMNLHAHLQYKHLAALRG